MGVRNVVTKEYVRNNQVFADICNYCIYDGDPIIRPETLEERDITELGVFDGGNADASLERLRDVLKLAQIKSCNGTTYAIIGIENQTNIDYTIVVRSMVNDALNYDTQVKRLAAKHKADKDLRGNEYISGMSAADRLIPVVTIIVYWNADEWDGARSLHDMLRIEDRSILKLINDYKLNLLVPREIDDFQKFSTDLGVVMEYISCAGDENAMQDFYNKSAENNITLSKEAARVLNTCVNANIEINSNEEGGRVNMCKAMDALVARGEARGEARNLLNMIDRFMLKNSTSLENACEVLSVTMEEYNSAKELLAVTN